MHRAKPFVAFVGAVALAAGALGALAGAGTAGASSPRPSLELIGPAQTAVGQMVAFDLVARNAPDLGAYQATLRFDGAALAVARIRAPRALPGSGALTALSAVETPNRKVLAGWSCSGRGCTTEGADAAVTTANTGTVLSTVDVVALRPGRIDLRIDGARLVRRSGTLLARASARAQLASGNGTIEYGAPSATTAPPTFDAQRAPRASADVNGDGRVTPLDVNALTADFVTATEHDRDCVAPSPGDDIDGDGCMTIADLQAVAGAISSAPSDPSLAAVRATPIKTFTVTSTGDGPDTTANGVCLNVASGTCTLRAAIQEANRVAGPVEIAFAVPGTAIHTIAPGSQLPSLNNPNGITIDGFTQSGSKPNTDPLVDNAVYRIELKGKGGNGMNGFVVVNANNLIRGVNMHDFNRAIWIYGTKATHNTVEGNMLGLTPTGNFDSGFTAIDSSNCITVQQGATYTQIGAPGDANRNLVSGCNHQNIATYDYPTAYTTIQNNIAGLDPTGKLKRGSKYHGIDINTGTDYTLIGGTDTQDRNLVSGNNREGIEISHYPTTLYNSIIGNYIGTDPTGNTAPAYARNGLDGVHLEGEPSCNNQACVPDMGYATVTNNIIVNAGRDGVLVDKGVHDSVIANNKIGVTANGGKGPSALAGVNIQAGSTHITLGPANEIANNPAGVELEPDGVEPVDTTPTVTQYDTITQNSIHDNGTTDPFGIDLAPFGAVNTSANADPNVNEAVLAPVLANPTETSLDANTCASCTVELFVADHPAGDHGSGSTYIATEQADDTGLASFTLPASADGKVVTADTTTPSGSTSEFSTNVAIPASSTDVPPTASFTNTCNGLVCNFNGEGSSDVDGHVVGYAWDFGDTHTSTGETTAHGFAAPGTYTVTLTVTDDGGATGTTSTGVMVVDLPPTAAFTGSCTGTSCSFDASTSTDPDNSIASYSWDFGDTHTGSGETVNYAYAAGGNYTVTLTVDDGEGGTSSVSHVFDAGATTTTVVAADTFTRTVASGWGTADTGGAYAAAPGSAGGAVNGTAGTFKLAKAATGGGEYLPGVTALDTDALVNVATNLAPAGGTWGQVAYLTARRVAANTEYRVRLRFTTSGTLRLSFVKVVGNTTEVMIGSEVAVSGVPYVAGRAYSLRFDVSGTSPTTLQAKAWVAGTTEPSKWTLTATDSESALQAAGCPGTRVFLGGNATNVPTWSFDNLSVSTLP
jgi:CSLREA domain-containing protein